MHRCRICNSTSNTTFTIKEMMQGTQKDFPYFQCADCGCLQIVTLPNDISSYYSENYYSKERLPSTRSKANLFFHKSIVRQYIFRDSIHGRFFARLRPNFWLPAIAPYITNKNTSILDVGCGTGLFLYTLKELGYTQVHGIDPYIERRIQYANGLIIDNITLCRVNGTWDFIMLNHSLEHMDDHDDVMRNLKRCLNPDGRIAISIPTVSSFAWEHYKEHWVQCDAPRHFILHSVESFQRVVERNGFTVESLIYNSNELQFYGSELYKRGISLEQYFAMSSSQKNTIFPPSDMTSYQEKARELNRTQQGDQFTAILRMH